MPDRFKQLAGTLYIDTKTGNIATLAKLKQDAYKAAQVKKAQEETSKNIQKWVGLLGQPNPARPSGTNVPQPSTRGRSTAYTPTSTPDLTFTPPTVNPNDWMGTQVPEGMPSLSFPEPNINPNDWMGTQVPESGQPTFSSPGWMPSQTGRPTDVSVRSSLGRQPRTFEELDALWKQGSITPEQYDQLELQISNNPYSPTSGEDMNYQDGNMDPTQQAGRAWWDRPWNFAGSDLSTELYMMGMGIGSKPGTRGRAAAIIGGGGAALFDIARNVTSGIGYQRRNQYVNDYYRQQQRRIQYNPVSETANNNSTGSIPPGQMGGMFVMGENGPEISNTGQWGGIGEYRIPSEDITMQGVDQPIMAVPENGDPVVMMPGQEYNFPGSSYVDEYPMYQPGGTVGEATPPATEPTPLTQQQVFEITMDWLNKHPMQVGEDKPLNIDNFEQVQTSGMYPKMSGKVAYVPKAGYFGEEKYKLVEMPEDYQGLDVYEINGKYVIFDQDFNKEYFNLYQEPKGKTREMWPVYGRGIPYRTQQFTSDPTEVTTPSYQNGGQQDYAAQVAAYKRSLQDLNSPYNTKKVVDRASNPDLYSVSPDGLTPKAVYQSSVSPRAYFYEYEEPTAQPAATPQAPATPKVGRYLHPNTGQPLPVEEYGSPGQADKQLMQYLDLVALQSQIRGRNGSKASFQDGGEQGEQKVGDYIEFEYDGEIKKGVIKKIENGKIFI